MENTELTYQSALEEIERIVSQIKSGSMPLEQLKGQIDRANGLLSFCKQQLHGVEQTLSDTQ